jgi:hypothetical protein
MAANESTRFFEVVIGLAVMLWPSIESSSESPPASSRGGSNAKNLDPASEKGSDETASPRAKSPSVDRSPAGK